VYDVLRHLCSVAAWPSEPDRRAAVASINEAEKMSVFGDVAKMIECPHDADLVDGRCQDCGRTIEVGQTGKRIVYAPIQRQGWR
jgi:hypothetical protein